MKKLCNILFTISVLLLITIITLRMNIVETISKEFTESKVSSYLISELRESLSILDERTREQLVDKLVNSNEFAEISTIFYKQILNDLNNNTVSDLDITDEINNLFVNNFNQIPPTYYNLLMEIVKDIDFNKIYHNIIFGIKDRLGDTLISGLSVYNIITSDSMISLLITIIIFSIIIIIIKTKSIIVFLNEIGMSLLIDGGLMMLILFFLNRVEVLISMALNTKIDLTLYTILTFLFIIVGFILKDIEIKKRRS